MIWRIINGSKFQKLWRISIQKNKIYLETKISPNREIFVFWRTFWIQNGRHSKPKWSQYCAACLTPRKYPFPLKSLNFLIFNNLFWFFLISILAAILKWWPFCPTDSDFFGLSRSTRCGCNRKHYCKNLWSLEWI